MQTTGKNRRKQIEAYDATHGLKLMVDSMEEFDFINYLDEAVKLGVFDDFQYQPRTFVLSEGVKYEGADGKSRTLFREHVYSPDFTVSFDPRKFPSLAAEFKVRRADVETGKTTVYIDTKGTFNKNERSFSTDRKWVWQKYSVYICKVVPKDFFRKFGCPALSFNTRKTGKSRKMFAGCRSIRETLGV